MSGAAGPRSKSDRETGHPAYQMLPILSFDEHMFKVGDASIRLIRLAKKSIQSNIQIVERSVDKKRMVQLLPKRPGTGWIVPSGECDDEVLEKEASQYGDMAGAPGLDRTYRDHQHDAFEPMTLAILQNC